MALHSPARKSHNQDESYQVNRLSDFSDKENECLQKVGSKSVIHTVKDANCASANVHRMLWSWTCRGLPPKATTPRTRSKTDARGVLFVPWSVQTQPSRCIVK